MIDLLLKEKRKDGAPRKETAKNQMRNKPQQQDLFFAAKELPVTDIDGYKYVFHRGVSISERNQSHTSCSLFSLSTIIFSLWLPLVDQHLLPQQAAATKLLPGQHFLETKASLLEQCRLAN